MPEWLTTVWAFKGGSALFEAAAAATPPAAVPLEDAARRLGAAFAMGCVSAVTYRLTMRNKGAGDPFLATLVLLSVLVALVTVVINDQLARAFSLVGALAIVRFRTVVEDTRDTAFVIYSVVMGMAAGLDSLYVPLLVMPVVLAVAWFFRPKEKVVEEKRREGRLVLRLAAVRPPEEPVRLALEKHLGGGRLIGLGTARGGAALDVTYAVALPAPEAAVALLAELSRIEGVQSVELKEE
jgi:uncharacterized membrane protein YhiD involved in acid resistance